MTLGQRAHIVGVGRQGPRSKAVPLSGDIDAVENLLLLCGEHHRIVDDNPRIYSVEVLAGTLPKEAAPVAWFIDPFGGAPVFLAMAAGVMILILMSPHSRTEAVSGLVIVAIGIPVYFLWRAVERPSA